MYKTRLIVKDQDGKLITSMDMPTWGAACTEANKQRELGHNAEVKDYYEDNPWD